MVIAMVDRSLAIAEPRPSSSPCVSRPFHMALGTGIVRSARIVARMRAIPVVACASVSRLARMRANGALLFAWRKSLHKVSDYYDEWKCLGLETWETLVSSTLCCSVFFTPLC